MHFAHIEDVLPPQTRIERLRDAVERMFLTLDEAEVAVVVRVAAAAQRQRLDRAAAVITGLGNGWLYLPLSLVLILTGRIGNPLRFLSAASMSLALAFLIYPPLKAILARTRPCDYEPALARFREPLDHYSCPSGHSMTVVAFSVALLFAWPAAAVPAALLCAVMGWSRVALGHHYLSDVLLGGAIGAAIAVPVSVFVY